MYDIARKILFRLNPEISHDLSLDMLGAAERLRLLKLFFSRIEEKPVELMGLRFPNPVGLAAGLDKNGDYFNALGQFGFGFVEIGTVTPKPQGGNPQPRMFRLEDERAIINRMGFNNKGLEHLVNNVKRRRYSGVLGINIGKNKTTPEHEALDDYKQCMETVYPYADYITINISSPNTPGLRDLQFGEAFDSLLTGIKRKRSSLKRKHGKHVPIAVKLAPDMSDQQLVETAETLKRQKLDAVIATNTTTARDGLDNSRFKDEHGGLSGAPLCQRSTKTIKRLSECLEGKVPIIGVGGIMDAEDAIEKIHAGASLVQIYSGLIYRGPRLVTEIVDAISNIDKLAAADKTITNDSMGAKAP